MGNSHTKQKKRMITLPPLLDLERIMVRMMSESVTQCHRNLMAELKWTD
jgi:hypothetical protein